MVKYKVKLLVNKKYKRKSIPKGSVGIVSFSHKSENGEYPVWFDEVLSTPFYNYPVWLKQHEFKILKKINETMKLKKLIVENECYDKFGKVLFGEFSRFYKKDQYEENTAYESKVFNQLIWFIRGEFVEKKKDQAIVKALKSLLDCKDIYPRVLKPKHQQLWRGLRITDHMKNYIKNKKDNFYKAQLFGRLFWVIKYKYKPTSIVQSWTSSSNVAFNYAVNNASKYIVLLNAKIPQSQLIFSHIFLNAIDKFVGQQKESEIIRVGKTIDAELYIPDVQYKEMFNVYDISDKWKRYQKLNYNKAPLRYGKRIVEFQWITNDGLHAHVIIKHKNRKGKYVDKYIDVPLQDLIDQNRK